MVIIELLPLPSKRNKPQQSCNTCRRRKLRSDRLKPCSRCSYCQHGVSCEDSQVHALPARSQGDAEMKDRIKRLEDLVLGLIQKTAMNNQDAPPSLICIERSYSQLMSQNVAEDCQKSRVAPSDQAKEDPSSRSSLDYRRIRIREWVLSTSTAHTEMLF